jgi:hypothetical protein
MAPIKLIDLVIIQINYYILNSKNYFDFREIAVDMSICD